MKLFFFLLITFFSLLAFGQKMPSDYFEEAEFFLKNNKYDEALREYQYIVDNHYKNELYPRAFYNIGYIYSIQKKYDNAIQIFKEVLESNFNEKEKLSGGIMDAPFTNYRNNACIILCDIYFERNMYDSALHYLALSDTVYSYLHFCGNAYASNEINTALRYAEIFQILNLPDKAIEKLLPTVFLNSLADNSKVIEELKKLLANKKGLKRKLDISLKKIYSKKIEVKEYSYILYYFKFLNVEIVVPDNPEIEFEKKKFNKSKKINQIKQTNFYKMIKQL